MDRALTLTHAYRQGSPSTSPEASGLSGREGVYSSVRDLLTRRKGACHGLRLCGRRNNKRDNKSNSGSAPRIQRFDTSKVPLPLTAELIGKEASAAEVHPSHSSVAAAPERSTQQPSDGRVTTGLRDLRCDHSSPCDALPLSLIHI